MTSPVLFTVATSLLALLLWRLLQIGKREHFLPPGPPTIPILGNAHLFPKIHPHHQFSKWARQYGDFFSLKIGSGTMIILSSSEAIHTILDKNSAITADRPPMHFADVVTSGGLNIFLARYGPKWRSLRRAAHEILTPQACLNHRPIQDAENAQMIYEILTNPADFYDHVRRYSGSVTLSVTFGKRAPRCHTKEIVDFFNVQHQWEHLLMPGSHPPVDFLPILKYVPEPFAKWKTACKTVRRLQRQLYFGLLEEVEKRQGEESGCFMELVRKRAVDWGLEREMIGYLGGALVEGGFDTTASFMQTLILGLTAFPETQIKAHEELDRVVGHDRTPVIEDLDSLPYIQAIIHEVHRFRPIAPLLPHATTADLEYRGCTIPAGTPVIANLWGMFHDPDVYDDPEDFKPERFIKTKYGTKKDKEDDLGRRNTQHFGSGRRMCAGMNLASYSSAISAMNLLWAFNFAPPRNSQGEEMKPDIWNYPQALSTHPNRFESVITLRRPEYAKIITRQFMESAPLFESFEGGLMPEDAAFVAEQRKGRTV